MRQGYWLAPLVLLLDQLSKWWVIEELRLFLRGSMQLTPFLSLTWVENRGISMGMFDLGDDGRWTLVAITGIIAVVVAWWLARETDRWDSLALAAILGGAIGNILDRARLGFVVDFVHFHAMDRSFYVFNVADAAITLGVLALLVRGLLRDEPNKRSN